MKKDTVKETVAEKRDLMAEIASNDKIKKDYSCTWTNTDEFGKVLEGMFGVTEFPAVVVQKKAGDKKYWIFKEELKTDDFVSYIEKVQSGEIKPNLKSEADPEGGAEQTGKPVKVVTGKLLEEMVFHKEKDVLLEIYAPWCGHCKKLEPEYEKVGKKVIKEEFENILTIAKMDGTANDSPVDSITWEGFPTLYYIKAGNNTPQKYEGPREAKGIWKWIKKNHTKADEIKNKIAAKKEKKDKEEPKAEKSEL